MNAPTCQSGRLNLSQKIDQGFRELCYFINKIKNIMLKEKIIFQKVNLKNHIGRQLLNVLRAATNCVHWVATIASSITAIRISVGNRKMNSELIN